MTARGLWKLTGIANTLQAWDDWNALACQAVDAGMDADDVDAISPSPRDGWRKIDKCIGKLRGKLEREYAREE